MHENVSNGVSMSFQVDIPIPRLCPLPSTHPTQKTTMSTKPANKATRESGHVNSPLHRWQRIINQDIESLFKSGQIPALRNLVDHLLQSEHGRFLSQDSTNTPTSLELPSSQTNETQENYPPLSPLGQKLLPNGRATNPPSHPSSRLRRLIPDQANGNIFNALCRIETIYERGEDSLEAALELEDADRLPSGIVAAFDELIYEYIEGPLRDSTTSPEGRTRAALALHTIRHVRDAIIEKKSDSFRFLVIKKKLLDDDRACGHGFGEMFERVGGWAQYGEEENDSLEYLMGITGGLLTVGASEKDGDKTDDTVGVFHADFQLYVTEEYNTFLASWECRK